MKVYAIIGILLLHLQANAQTAREIMQRVDEKVRGTSNKSEMKMTIVRPEWKREVTMKGWSLGTEYSLILITGPARDKGQAFLKRDNEMWNWQPSIDRVVKLPPSMMLQSWMGSDFTNDDLVKESSIVNDYDQHLEQDSVINGASVYKILLMPKPDAPVVWGKVVCYVEKKEYNQLLVKYYDEDGYLVNTMVLSDIKEMGGRRLPSKLEMIPHDNPNHRTIIQYLDQEFNIGLKESFFSMQNMKRVR
ncbi:MAG: outer membrane lipoprotein-sorting protein [Cyclobacteriaceae bacterium]|nr:outer membrane lipoprotein-sorting protein [Cyclobacteriaceae bacterium]MCB0499694.1 outer membrane lipoprotein-sorting protein [Cyclobacteriaceae bacterium]MCB9239381.1 outer membrane lipoprotein-sorting protein [Flammeovirgaceae bacterium]MCW5902558.1 outer membrane lipoprotein-sorting protein [Cyclobacteriaceae bacterium]HPI79387.1 outer membrane lipoprotein-sorting protein [Cyclobacteriaceae bacterium]